MKTPLLDRLRSRLQRVIQTRLWGMDIHPTAQVANTALVDRTWPKGIHIGPGCTIGEEAVILTHDFTRGLYLDTRIGARTKIGPRAIIMPGVNHRRGLHCNARGPRCPTHAPSFHCDREPCLDQ
jgi:serine acetyltransferase